MIKNRRKVLRFLSIAGVSAVVLSDRFVESVANTLVRPANAQTTLPDAFIGVGLAASYLNQTSPQEHFLVPAEAAG